MEKELQPKFVVQPMTVDDVGGATAMRMQAWRGTYRNDELGVTAEWLDEIIGVSMPFVMDDDTQRLGGLYVDKEWHGKGVGASLIQKALAWHDLRKPIILGVASYNERAKAFYRKYGFVEISDSVEMFRGKIPTVRMIQKPTKEVSDGDRN